jgi:hypothetical protein
MDDTIKARALFAFAQGGGLAQCISLAATLVPSDTKQVSSSDEKIVTTDATVFRYLHTYATFNVTCCYCERQ